MFKKLSLSDKFNALHGITFKNKILFIKNVFRPQNYAFHPIFL
jgi:hypothetical protein